MGAIVIADEIMRVLFNVWERDVIQPPHASLSQCVYIKWSRTCSLLLMGNSIDSNSA